ncbi:MAG TPA: hypothetical protein VN667_17145 [Burkholderiales bacterium]|nr:hypothetical protein [Burkholderiales bacterium]
MSATAANEQPSAQAEKFSLSNLPAVGTPMLGGIFKGLTLFQGKPMGLVLLDGDMDDDTWDKARAYADAKGGELPTRIDALVLFEANEGDFLEDVYWTCQTHAADADYAWDQYFTGGTQGSWLKSCKLRARAVRRFIID